MRWGDGLGVPARTPRKCRAHPHPLRPDPSLILASRGFPFPSSAHRPLPPRPCLEAGTIARLALSGKAKRRDFLRCGGQARTVSPVDVMAVIGSQLTYCVEVAAELLADVEEQTVRSVHQAQRPGRESPAFSPR